MISLSKYLLTDKNRRLARLGSSQKCYPVSAIYGVCGKVRGTVRYILPLTVDSVYQRTSTLQHQYPKQTTTIGESLQPSNFAILRGFPWLFFAYRGSMYFYTR
jgi:hypothetical protein